MQIACSPSDNESRDFCDFHSVLSLLQNQPKATQKLSWASWFLTHLLEAGSGSATGCTACCCAWSMLARLPWLLWPFKLLLPRWSSKALGHWALPGSDLLDPWIKSVESACSQLLWKLRPPLWFCPLSSFGSVSPTQSGCEWLLPLALGHRLATCAGYGSGKEAWLSLWALSSNPDLPWQSLKRRHANIQESILDNDAVNKIYSYKQNV